MARIKTPFTRALGNALRIMRTNAKLTQGELAAMIGDKGARRGGSYQMVQKHENGTSSISLERFFAWCEACGVDPVAGFKSALDIARLVHKE